MADNSDYNKPRTKLHQLLPEVYQSDTSKAVFENLFNRFFSKNETENVIGYIGKGNANAVIKRQITEPTLHRQAFQLQPILNAKIGSVDYVSSWKDLLNELERIGVDIERLPVWGAVQQFNWVPPIDLDKLINYQDYYWYDEDHPNSRPDYIVIRNRCAQATAYATFWEQLTESYGTQFPIIRIEQIDNPVKLTLVSVSGGNTINVAGNIVGQIVVGDKFELTDTTSNDGTYVALTSPVFNQVTNQSSFTVSNTLINEAGGTVALKQYDKIVISGDFTRPFEEGFQFHVRQSSNIDLNNSTFAVVSSSYDEDADETTIVINATLNDDTADGILSLAEALTAAQTARDCACSGATGWDQLPWDDNPSSPTWGGIPPGDHFNLIEAISHPSGPSGAPTSSSAEDTLWYDTTADRLYEWNGSDWIVVINTFSTVLEQTTGTNLWDDSSACSTPVLFQSAQQWINSNKWVHKTEVKNFTIAKRAQFPIIEYDYDLELNEWTYTTYNWRYRKDPYTKWADATLTPELIELIPLNIINGTSNDELYLDEAHGDLTEFFTPGRIVNATNGGLPVTITVTSSYYVKLPGESAFRTVLTVDSPMLIDNTFNLVPTTTSVGDDWRGYNIHWVFAGANNAVPVNHQTTNPLTLIDEAVYVTHSSGNYQYANSPYSQDNVLLVNAPVATFELATDSIPGSNRTLAQRALAGSDDIRVYVNGVRQYGTYDELDDGTYVTGIRFLTGFIPSTAGTVVRIEVGSASTHDIGFYAVPVRTEENDSKFTGPVLVSLVQYRKAEQIKDGINQYPLFDMYHTDGTSAYAATPIFTYQTSPTADLVPELGLRLVQDKTLKNFGFQQHIITDDGGMLAYRDYSNQKTEFWYNPESGRVNKWDAVTWSGKYYLKTSSHTYYIPVLVGPQQPSVTDPIAGELNYLWLDTTTQELKIRVDQNDSPSAFTVITDNANLTYDHTLQTIWKAGRNNEQYVPKKVDWEGRTKEQYDIERSEYIVRETSNLVLSGVDPNTAKTQATDAWYKTQQNVHSPTGEWVGDWEIPAPLYFNNQHENRRFISYRELLTHFNTIIEAQPKIPGFSGSKANMFHLLTPSQVNFGLGGKIKEFNDGFDTFLSSVFVNNVTPLSLLEFAHDQYKSLSNNLREQYRSQIIELLTNTSLESLEDFDKFVINTIIDAFEENDHGSLIYGDSTTSAAIRNWIATLPYFGLVPKSRPLWHKSRPFILQDDGRGINMVSHHDGHLDTYAFPASTLESISRSVVHVPDLRGNVADTFGRISNTAPPTTRTAFELEFSSTIENREGVYWYHVPASGDRVLYRLSLVKAGPTQPATKVDGAMWFDTDTNLLYTFNSGSWTTDGMPDDIAAAWTVVEFNDIINQLILEVETRLYDNVPTFVNKPYDVEATKESDVDAFNKYTFERFMDYVVAERITAPFKNTRYNPSDAYTWNYTYSTIGSAYEIHESHNETSSFVISGDYTTEFTAGQTFYIKNSDSSNDGTWVTSANATYDPTENTTRVYVDPQSRPNGVVETLSGVIYKGTLPSSTHNTGAESAGDWRALYTEFYGTPYPHLEPWKLQGYLDKPDWWDSEYADTTGTRRWNPLMWTNIQNGVIPATRDYPNGVVSITGNPSIDRTVHLLQAPSLPTYNYVSVNVESTSIVGQDGKVYQMDEVLPPYWVPPSPNPYSSRSIFTDINEIVAPSADFVFGKPGVVEWEWRTSAHFNYDILAVAYRMDPVRYVTHTFGKKFDIVGSLQIDPETSKAFSHSRTNFHGDVVDDKVYQVPGTNQWYVNYNRYVGFDASYSDFRSLWTQWTAPLTYQMSSFIDTESFLIGHRTIPITEFDWKIKSKRSNGVEDFWLDALNVTVLDMPPPVSRYNNEKQWKFEVNTNIPLSRTLSYYDVRNYKFVSMYNVVGTSKVPTGTFSLYTYNITDIDTINNTVSVDGEHPEIITGRVVTILASAANGGTYIIETAAYNPATNKTIISLNGGLTNPASLLDLGMLQLSYRELPWVTGDRVFLTTEETLPAPFIDETEYFIIVETPTQFKLARTRQDALNGVSITPTSLGRRIHYVGELFNTFIALDGERTNTNWKHYVLDKTNILTLTTPQEVSGIQNIINIVDGYSAFLEDEGWRINVSGEYHDPTISGRVVNWQVELERFIDYIHGIRSQRNKPASIQYKVTVDDSTSTFTFTEQYGQFLTGDPVILIADNNIYPAPFRSNIKYFVIRESLNTFKLAASKSDAEKGVALQVLGPVAPADMWIAPATEKRQGIVQFELNPFRNGVWFRPERGIVSNVFTGPSDDVRTTQLIFDQYGRPLPRNITRILREDKQTQISVLDGVPNDVELTSIFEDPYNYIHLGGMHLFLDTFEHILVFNNYTTEGLLLYDPYVGLNVTKYELQFRRQSDFTQRPNVGGFYLSTFFNQDASLKRNIEASVEDLRNLYDTYTSIESSPLIQTSRKSLGYDGLRDYLSNLNLGPKSQFVFWRGLIQQKGSVNAINAFTNSRRFVNATVDEFWAIKRAEFGSSGEKEYPELYLTAEDARSNDLRIDFVTEDDLCFPGYATNVYDQSPCGYAYPENGEPVLVGENNFLPILLTDEDRWHNQPDQLEKLKNNGQTMFFTLKPVGVLDVPPDALRLDTNPSDPTIIRHGFKADTLQVLADWHGPGKSYSVVINGTTAGNNLTLPDGYEYIPFADSLRVFKNGTLLTTSVDYSETLSTGLLSTELFFPEELIPGDEITIIYTTAKLVEDLHYSNINSDVIDFIFPELITGDDGQFPHKLQIWGMVQDDTTQDPAKIVDIKSNVVVTPVQMWDPARGMHYYNAEHNIDLFNNEDPAIYNQTLVQQYTNQDQGYFERTTTQMVGKTWLDTSTLDYFRYYDPKAVTDLEERFTRWGSLADFSTIKVREWVESDVHPSEWNALAEVEENDITIPEHTRKSGRVSKTLFRKIGSTWTRFVDQILQLDVAIDGTPEPLVITPTYYDFDISSLEFGSMARVVDVYVNGRLVIEGHTETSFESGVIRLTTDQIKLADHVTIVVPAPTDQETIDSLIEANPSTYAQDYEYTEIKYYDNLGVERSRFYFWVENKVTRNSNRTLSPIETQTQLVSIPTPYMFFQGLKDPTRITIDGFPVEMPLRMSQCIIRGLRGIINDDKRYILRYLRDYTLRDELHTGKSSIQLKNKHEEWELVREKQNEKIRRALWDLITESLVGFKLDNPSVVVPSLTRSLYDATHGTETSYGFGPGQAFANKTLALEIILADLQNPANDFSPIDINAFFQRHSFETIDDIIDSMNTIYETFAADHVNRIFFAVLHNASLSQKTKFEGIFKTSMISLKGVRPLEAESLFDD